MNIYSKYIFLLVFGLFINLSLSTQAVATIEFYLLPVDAKQNVDCDFLEIKDNHALCTANNLLITYEISQLKKIEVVYGGIASSFLLFTQETQKIINDANSNKKQSQKENQQVKNKQIKFDYKDFGLNSFQRLIDYFIHPTGSSTFSTILAVSGRIVFLIGSFGFIIATFRVGILWGFSCIFFPLVSIFFLFVHWKTAVKSFLLTLLGIAILFIGIFFAPTNQNTQNIAKLTPVKVFDNKRKKKGNYRCNGKIYCSEMSSCTEAKFYLRNCPGTKMDGDNDGIPCEKQWCGH